MADERRADIHDMGSCLEAERNSLIEIEATDSNGRSDNHEKESHGIHPYKLTPSAKSVTESSATKDNTEDKYIDQANFNRASICSTRMDNADKESTEPTTDGYDEIRPENNASQSKGSEKTSEKDKEEGNYEELVCLVRQFYVERPINPAAIAYQNIETC